MTGRLLVHGTVVTVDSERRILDDGAVLIVNDRIADVGLSDHLLSAHPDAQRWDCTGRIVIPGLVNTHTHLFQTLLKGLGDDMVLKDWFTTMTGPSAAVLTPEDVYAAARHGGIEALRSGTTTIADFMYVHPVPELTDQVIRALDETGIRAVVGRGYMTTGVEAGVPPNLIEDLDVALGDAERLIHRHNQPDARIRVALAPTMIWTVDADTLTATRQLADDLSAPVMMHVSETSFEIDNAVQRFGRRDVEVLADTGLLGPDLLAVHCVQCNDTDLRLLAEHDVKISHNPCSNLYLASGVAPVPEMLSLGLTVGLATDGPASNNNHNMIHTLKFAALTHKGHRRDATIITAETVLEMATIGGAAALGLDADIGSIEPGKKADLVILDPDNPCIAPLHHPVSALVYAAIGDEPDTVIIDGLPVMTGGTITTIDEHATRTDAIRQAVDLAQRAGTTHLGHRPWRGLTAR